MTTKLITFTKYDNNPEYSMTFIVEIDNETVSVKVHPSEVQPETEQDMIDYAVNKVISARMN